MTGLAFSHVSDTPIGTVACISTERGLLAVEIGPESPRDWAASIRIRMAFDSRIVTRPSSPAVDQILEYLTGKRRRFDLPIDWRLTSPFQQGVLEAVAAVPYGETRTYGAIADQIGRTGAARAVGRANALNPLSLVLPCHRLVGADGSLRGYRAPDGIRTKAWLLALERGEIARV